MEEKDIGLEDYKHLNYITYHNEYFLDEEQLFTTTTEVLKKVKAGDKLICSNLSEKNCERNTILPSYELKVLKGENKDAILTLTDEVYHKNILNPNLKYSGNVEIEIVSIKDKEIKYKLNNLAFFRF